MKSIFRLQSDFFRSKRIKKLHRLAGGDTYILIYIKLMLISMETEGKLIQEGTKKDFCKELADELDERVENIDIAINILSSLGLMDREGDVWQIKECSQ